MSFFLVYSYNNFSGYSRTVYHRGIYTTLSEAKKRQIKICGEDFIKGIYGSTRGNGHTVFINVLLKEIVILKLIQHHQVNPTMLTNDHSNIVF